MSEPITPEQEPVLPKLRFDNPRRQWMDAVLLGLVVFGAILRLWQYLANTSLWMDEIFLTTSILHRSLRQLLTLPLDYGQVAPTGFLLAEKLLTASMGPSDAVLKFYPFLCSLAGLVAFACVVRRLLNGIAAPVALALFATAPSLVAFATQVKQYSSDVAIAVILLVVATSLVTKEVSLKYSLVAGAIGAVALWFSQPAILVVGGLGVSLILISYYERSDSVGRRMFALAPALGLWGISALAATVISLVSMSPHTREFMHDYWQEGFMPTPPWRAFQARWPWRELQALIGRGGLASLNYPFSRFYGLLIALGFLALWRRLGVRATLLLMPVVAALSAAVIHQYPFADRLILFLVPSFLVALAASVDWLYQWAVSWSKYLGWFLCIALVGPLVYPVALPPYRIEDMKPVMSHLQANWRAGDGVYVFHGADPAFRFYSADYGFRDPDYVLGRCHHGVNLGYRLELDAFRGRPRVWVVLTHAIPYFHERDDILSYLDTIGVRRDYFVEQSRASGLLPAEVILYDLSDPRRLESATATSIPLIGPTSVEERLVCEGDPPVIVPPR
jgi:hypothetical protein